MTMQCEEAQQTIRLVLDDEVEPVQMLELEEHVNGCDACRGMLEREGRLRETVRRAGQAVLAPPTLRRRIRAVLDQELQSRGRFGQLWPALAAAAVLVALIAKGAGGGSSFLSELDEAAQRHARDLPLDVIAADVGQVQRYFDGKLPFAVNVPRLNHMHVQQLGGRITQLHDRDAAYVRYDVPQGRVAVFVYQDPGTDISEVAPLYQVGRRRVALQTVRGYTVARWRSAGLVYSVVTNLPPNLIPVLLGPGAAGEP